MLEDPDHVILSKLILVSHLMLKSSSCRFLVVADTAICCWLLTLVVGMGRVQKAAMGQSVPMVSNTSNICKSVLSRTRSSRFTIYVSDVCSARMTLSIGDPSAISPA